MRERGKRGSREEGIVEVPRELYYSRDHQWARVAAGRATVGITDYAQGQLGDVVYLELPVEGDRVEAGKNFGVIESVKAVSDLLAPVSGKVVEVNHELTDHLEWINQDPYGKGWMIVVAMEAPAEIEGLLDDIAYLRLISEQE